MPGRYLDCEISVFGLKQRLEILVRPGNDHENLVLRPKISGEGVGGDMALARNVNTPLASTITTGTICEASAVPRLPILRRSKLKTTSCARLLPPHQVFNTAVCQRLVGSVRTVCAHNSCRSRSRTSPTYPRVAADKRPYSHSGP